MSGEIVLEVKVVAEMAGWRVSHGGRILYSWIGVCRPGTRVLNGSAKKEMSLTVSLQPQETRYRVPCLLLLQIREDWEGQWKIGTARFRGIGSAIKGSFSPSELRIQCV